MLKAVYEIISIPFCELHRTLCMYWRSGWSWWEWGKGKSRYAPGTRHLRSWTLL